MKKSYRIPFAHNGRSQTTIMLGLTADGSPSHHIDEMSVIPHPTNVGLLQDAGIPLNYVSTNVVPPSSDSVSASIETTLTNARLQTAQSQSEVIDSVNNSASN